jgi:hypothetical protein
MKTIKHNDRWEDLYTSKRRLIACATVIEEILPILPEDVPFETLDFGLHINPPELKQVLQQKIDQHSSDADVLLLGYGLCSMAIVGLTATDATLVIPRTDDCIAIFLGSSASYKQQAKKEPGTYYLTKGWIEVGDTPFEEHHLLVEKFGLEKAERLTGLLLRNYTRLAYIDTGQYEAERYRDYARTTAEQFSLRYEELDGSPALVRKLIFGPWDDEFMVIPPGKTITYQDYLQQNSDPV